jgi:hypothetical protein
MPAWIAGIQVRMDASGDVRVGLDSSNPCWNDGIDGVCLTAANVFNDIFKGGHEDHEGKVGMKKTSNFVSFVRFVVSECSVEA